MRQYRRNTKQFLIAEIASRGLTKKQAYSELSEMVRNQVPPMIFKRNDPVTHSRVPKPMADQYDELRYTIGRVYKEIGRADSPDFDSPEKDQPETPEPEKQPVRKAADAKRESELEKFKRRIRELRKFCDERAKLSEKIDSISLRPSQAAVKLIPAGI